LLESAYEECLHYELEKHGLIVIKQKPMPLIYEEKKQDLGYRIDLFVEGKVIIEILRVKLCETPCYSVVQYFLPRRYTKVDTKVHKEINFYL